MKMIGILNKKKFQLPKGIKLIEFPDKIRFRGTADQLDRLSIEIRKISELTHKKSYRLKKYTFAVSESIPQDFDRFNIRIPAEAWGIMASKFKEVANGWEDSPFDFNNCGFLTPKLEFDIGVELIGKPNPR